MCLLKNREIDWQHASQAMHMNTRELLEEYEHEFFYQH
jgi:hypothetical protein